MKTIQSALADQFSSEYKAWPVPHGALELPIPGGTCYLAPWWGDGRLKVVKEAISQARLFSARMIETYRYLHVTRKEAMAVGFGYGPAMKRVYNELRLMCLGILDSRDPTMEERGIFSGIALSEISRWRSDVGEWSPETEKKVEIALDSCRQV